MPPSDPITDDSPSIYTTHIDLTSNIQESVQFAKDFYIVYSSNITDIIANIPSDGPKHNYKNTFFFEYLLTRQRFINILHEINLENISEPDITIDEVKQFFAILCYTCCFDANLYVGHKNYYATILDFINDNTEVKKELGTNTLMSSNRLRFIHGHFLINEKLLSTIFEIFRELVEVPVNFFYCDKKLFHKLHLNEDQLPMDQARVGLKFFQIKIMLKGDHPFTIFSSLKKLDEDISDNMLMVKSFVELYKSFKNPDLIMIFDNSCINNDICELLNQEEVQYIISTGERINSTVPSGGIDSHIEEKIFSIEDSPKYIDKDGNPFYSTELEENIGIAKLIYGHTICYKLEDESFESPTIPIASIFKKRNHRDIFNIKTNFLRYNSNFKTEEKLISLYCFHTLLQNCYSYYCSINNITCKNDTKGTFFYHTALNLFKSKISFNHTKKRFS